MFFATYKFINVKNYKIFGDKLVFHVVNLKHIDIATEEDRAYGIDEWARFFKATTWEEIQMLAEKNSSICEAANAMYDFTSDEVIREQIRMREEFIRRNRGMERMLKMAKEDAEMKMKELVKSKEELVESQEKLVDSQEELVKSQEELVKSLEKLKENSEELEKSREELAKNKEELANRKKELEKSREELAKVKQEVERKIERLQSEFELAMSGKLYEK